MDHQDDPDAMNTSPPLSPTQMTAFDSLTSVNNSDQNNILSGGNTRAVTPNSNAANSQSLIIMDQSQNQQMETTANIQQVGPQQLHSSTFSTDLIPPGITWVFCQQYGPTEEAVNEYDVISAVEFNTNGDFVAVGDRGGRIVIFEHNQNSTRTKSVIDQYAAETEPPQTDVDGGFSFYSTFQSHESEFDYLKSLEIEEKINQIRWLRPGLPHNYLLSTNDKTIKLWKLKEESMALDKNSLNIPADQGIPSGDSRLNVAFKDRGSLRVPRYQRCTRNVRNIPRRIFANAHQFHINSIGVRADGDLFLSADDLRINLWHIENNSQSFNIVDMKPEVMENLSEVITCAEFHPVDPHLFTYGSSRGCIRLADMRVSALCDQNVTEFSDKDQSDHSFFTEIIESISDVKFSHCGRYFASRDFMFVKIWDRAMPNRPCERYHVHDFCRPKLCTLYENDSIFDRFSVSWAPDDKQLLTGSYGNCFRLIERDFNQSNAAFNPQSSSYQHNLYEARQWADAGVRMERGALLEPCTDPPLDDDLTWQRKLLHCAWHPTVNTLAVSATHNLFIYTDKDHRNSDATPSSRTARLPTTQHSIHHSP